MRFHSRRPELAELLLEDLPRRVLGERAEELDRLGDFVGRDRVVADLPELLRCDAPALLQHHVAFHASPPPRLGPAANPASLHAALRKTTPSTSRRETPPRTAAGPAAPGA